MGRKNRCSNGRWPSAERNSQSWLYYFNMLYNICLSEFKWLNVPDTIDVRYLERCLFYKGLLVFFEDPIIGALGLNCAIGGRMSVYDIPLDRHAYAPNGYHADLTAADSVLMFNNMGHTPDVQNIYYFCDKLWEIDRTLDVNLKGQKTPVLITGSEAMQLTLKNLMMKVDGNEPFIYGEKSLDTSGIKVFKTDAPFLLDKMHSYKKEVLNEALNYIGINSMPDMKRERMVVDEVNVNVEHTIANRYSRLAARRQACEECNRMFGWGMDVIFNPEIDTIANITGTEDVSVGGNGSNDSNVSRETSEGGNG